MAIYSLAQRTTVNAAAAEALWEVINTATNKPRIMELGFSQVTGVSATYGLGRPAAKGVGATTPVAFQDEQDGNNAAGLTTGAVAWATTAPTVPAQFFRRITTPATIGAGVIWTFPRGLSIVANVSIVLWNIPAVAPPLLDVWAVEDE